MINSEVECRFFKIAMPLILNIRRCSEHFIRTAMGYFRKNKQITFDSRFQGAYFSSGRSLYFEFSLTMNFYLFVDL